MRFSVVTLFPEIFASLLETSLIGKAEKAGLIVVDFVDPRDFTTDRHRTVDDAPYGGGEGMVLKPGPYVAAIEAASRRAAERDGDAEAGKQRASRRVLLCPQGQPLTQRHLRRLADAGDVTLVCGRYEGYDERIRHFVDDEISLGDFVLNGGEVAAMAILDGVSRLVPGVIGNAASLEAESHAEGLLEYPQYTRPPVFRGHEVPEILRSGDHGKIATWRREQMEQRTRERRPDLWARAGGRGATSSDQRQERAARSYIALLHHPVHDRSGRVVTTALTNLDLHDIARSARSFGLAGYFVVTPLPSQQELAGRIIGHWREGHGANVHEKRAEALRLIEVAPDLTGAIDAIEAREGRRPLTIATSARPSSRQVGFDQLDDQVPDDVPLLILLGTGWGLTAEVLDAADLHLEPVRGAPDYNHLSVRSAAAIILDRCFGMRE
ncbi:MAG: tRNA (guanosine(37)-N1)-methyltransferase TrmD [Proteobacteria bacterium]|nr:MAG: tRNA (guanosine(37)-N1)-methyltransferase TrmD [Pseudomonadota bacterium]PIE17910.1 MAG: tRNA (guanosine(37)-N1)-methyltransferase TrmD [Pseudomonadota bacterium]